MMKSVISVLVALCVASPAAAFEWQFKDNMSYDQTNLVAATAPRSLTTARPRRATPVRWTRPRTRDPAADIVQGVQASQGRGRVNSDK